MSTAEVEAALMGHPSVAEAAVVSRPHKVKGECLYCFVSLKDHLEFNHSLEDELKMLGEEEDPLSVTIQFMIVVLEQVVVVLGVRFQLNNLLMRFFQ